MNDRLSQSNDYEKYFIENDIHIGEYEAMYRNCRDPWRIEELGVRLDMKAALLLLDNVKGPINHALDAGAGNGLFTEQIVKRLWREHPQCLMTLTDISTTALTIAADRLSGPSSRSRPDQNERRPEPTPPPKGARLDYVAFDLRWANSDLRPWPDNHFDLIILAQVVWGLLENLTQSLEGLARMTRPGGYLLLTQHFFQPGKQRYGLGLVETPEDLSLFVRQAGFHLVDSLEINRETNYHWASLWQWI
ncbi:MAG: class I SAM-dependent methyltransferase [Deltaproteobacteria bacterium]|jgi:SAM-dependent methyltransferase|nr:class I SAM-dependent methyltransferase [Deltaproteobacteria bacterium]